MDGEELGEELTLESAIALACDSAEANSRSAWLLDETGHPTNPIELQMHRAWWHSVLLKEDYIFVNLGGLCSVGRATQYEASTEN
ncbi:MAG: hypothetical protein QF681_11845 [Vicinamibacterales bacterium]|jgi:hypothetical protein|nr:hypothetical protein [Vicinamibacterales bacterium]